MGLYHVENSLYLGGGVDGSYPNYKYFSKFVKVLSDGEVTELQMMPNSRCNFAMTLWKKRTLFTLGGYRQGSYLNQIQEYSI